jgi:hypothetical protein
MSPTAKAALYGSSMAVVVAVVFGIYLFATTDAFAAALGLVGMVVLLTGGVVLGLVLARERPEEMARLSSRRYLPLLTLGVVLLWLVIFVRYL